MLLWGKKWRPLSVEPAAVGSLSRVMQQRAGDQSLCRGGAERTESIAQNAVADVASASVVIPNAPPVNYSTFSSSCRSDRNRSSLSSEMRERGWRWRPRERDRERTPSAADGHRGMKTIFLTKRPQRSHCEANRRRRFFGPAYLSHWRWLSTEH